MKGMEMLVMQGFRGWCPLHQKRLLPRRHRRHHGREVGEVMADATVGSRFNAQTKQSRLRENR